MNKTKDPILQRLQALTTIREQAQRILSLARHNQLTHFTVNDDKLPATADFVLSVMNHQYPNHNIPYHTRWRHFEAGGVDRIGVLRQRIEHLPRAEQGRILFELVIISVFLDAGAGDHWQYLEKDSGQTFTRSEGLGVASMDLYLSGAFSAVVNQPFRVDSNALQAFSDMDLAQGFQVSSDNPLNGLAGRVALLNRLGASLAQQPDCFGRDARLGNFFDTVTALQRGNELPADTLFQTVLQAFAAIWPERLRYQGQALGDVWTHAQLKTDAPGSEYIPFHKLSQWLSYSLVEPLEQLGTHVTNLNALTGLAEYRNGGLFLDMGVLQLKDEQQGQMTHDPGSELIVEWRALTVALLDELADAIRHRLQCDANSLPLAKILQGGTWEAGRRMARQKRPNGAPPLTIVSDGTVF